MLVFLTRRFIGGLLVLFVTATLVFFAVFALGNPVDVMVSPDADQAERAAAIARLGLDRPILEQYASFLWNAVRGDLGNSFVYGKPATTVILERLPVTLELAIVAMVIALGIGLPLGIIAGLKPAGLSGKAIMSGSILGFSLPNFWIGLMLISIFAVQLKWLPSGGRGPTVDVLGIPLSILSLEGLKYLILPAFTLALYKTSLIIRICETGTRNVNRQDYIRTARARGVPPGRIVTVHLLKNVIIPVITVMGLEFGAMIAFAVAVETVFSYPGMGKLLIDSINRIDRPVIVAYLMVTCLIFVTVNLIVDALYAVLDPRVRFSASKA